MNCFPSPATNRSMDVERTAVLPDSRPKGVAYKATSSWLRAFRDARAETGPLFLVLWIYAAAAGAVSTGMHVSLLASLAEYAKIIGLLAAVGTALGIL